MPLFETPTEPRTPPSATPTGTEQDSATQTKAIVAGRHGEWDTHELIRLLDTIEDERARGRFRESLYLSVFCWIVIAWFLFYGPRVLWHAPQLRDPASVLRERELTQLTLPKQLTPAMKEPRPAPKPAIDKATMERLRAMSKPAPAPAPTPEAAPPPPAPVAAAPPPPPPPVDKPRLPQPVADAPTMQPTKPNFGAPASAGSSIREALNDAAHNRGGVDTGGGRPVGRSGGPLNIGGAEVLSDTQNVDFGPYIRRVLSDIKRNWDPLIPAEAESPLYKQGESFIRFTINADGSIAAMHLDDSTHDEAINRSCWGSITSEGQFPPLPKEFHGPNLELRIHYLVNKQIE